MKTEALLTKLSDREARTNWEKKGAFDTHARAMTRAKEILSKPSSVVFTDEIESRIRGVFPNLVTGNLEMPE